MAKDLFSRQTSLYAKHRPTYPEALYQYILDHVEEKGIAWDCATGNGQAAFALADHFKKVIGTDISEKQLMLAKQHPKILYFECAAEKTDFPDNTFDLITIAQAYHWFDFDSFEKEATRVAKHGAIVAAWGYNLMTTHDQRIDALIQKMYSEIAGPYWDEERKYVEQNYETLPFRFALLPARSFTMDRDWKRDDLVGYLLSWSATQKYIADKNSNPIDLINGELTTLWKDEEIRSVSFPLFLKLGKVEKEL